MDNRFNPANYLKMLASKKNLRVLKISALIGICHTLTSQSLPAQTDSIVNERIPVTAQQLESHWKVDCGAALKQAEHFLAKSTEVSHDVHEDSGLHSDIEKCMYIYNSPNSAHYSDMPDYKALLDKLNNVSH